MKKILLPTDFSENSWNAIKYALQLYVDQECNFILLHTYTPAIVKWEYMQSSSAQLQIFDAMKATSKKGLEEMLQKITSEFNNPKHTFSQISAFNILTMEIEELYKGNAMDMIVMGTKGASGVERVLFGSNTIHVLKHAKCPVLVVPAGFSFEIPHEILFPSDFEIGFNDKHLQPVVDIADSFGSRINVLHVNYGANLTELQEVNKKRMERHLKETTYLFHDMSDLNVPEAIEEFQMKQRFNLLVMLNNKHSFFENLFFRPIINHIGFHLNIPFLVISAKP